MRKIEELVRNQCHDGRLIGKEVADGVRDIVHELWLVSNYVEEGRLLKTLKGLGVSKKWIREALHKPMRDVEHLMGRYGLGDKA